MVYVIHYIYLKYVLLFAVSKLQSIIYHCVVYVFFVNFYLLPPFVAKSRGKPALQYNDHCH